MLGKGSPATFTSRFAPLWEIGVVENGSLNVWASLR